jgi:multicomponent Na+:H+ antiporter subunit E
MPGWTRPWRVLAFAAFYLWEVVASSMAVAWRVVTPRRRMRSGIIGVPVESRTPFEVTWLANLISLTPGTLTVDADPDQNILYVHGLHVPDPDAFRAEIRRLEQRLLKVLR